MAEYTSADPSSCAVRHAPDVSNCQAPCSIKGTPGSGTVNMFTSSSSACVWLSFSANDKWFMMATKRPRLTPAATSPAVARTQRRPNPRPGSGTPHTCGPRTPNMYRRYAAYPRSKRRCPNRHPPRRVVARVSSIRSGAWRNSSEALYRSNRLVSQLRKSLRAELRIDQCLRRRSRDRACDAQRGSKTADVSCQSIDSGSATSGHCGLLYEDGSQLEGHEPVSNAERSTRPRR